MPVLLSRRVLDGFDRFLASGHRNTWLEYPRIKVYVRRSTRVILGCSFPFVDLATVDVPPQHQGNGIFTTFLEHVEKSVENLYIENVMDVRFQRFFEGRNYVKLIIPGGIPQVLCYVRLKEVPVGFSRDYDQDRVPADLAVLEDQSSPGG
jgi:hypothetical protein